MKIVIHVCYDIKLEKYFVNHVLVQKFIVNTINREQREFLNIRIAVVVLGYSTF